MIGVNGPVGKMAAGGVAASAGRGPSERAAVAEAWAGFTSGAVARLMLGLGAPGGGAGVLDAVAVEAGPAGVAQPESHAITANRQIDVNFIGRSWLELERTGVGLGVTRIGRVCRLRKAAIRALRLFLLLRCRRVAGIICDALTVHHAGLAGRARNIPMSLARVKMGSRVMSAEKMGLQDWFQTPPGRYLLAWERAQFDSTVADVFGYHALQLGLPALDALSANRMPHRWLAMSPPSSTATATATAPSTLSGPGDPPATGAADRRTMTRGARAALMADFAALPFPANSLDLVVLPHTLELNVDPHAALREVERVLVPEGRVVISGLNPASLWGLRQRRAHFYRRFGPGELFLPEAGDSIGYWRMRDWLRLLSFEVEAGRFGCYRPAVASEKWLQRFEWMDRAGERWWPILGAVYFLVAVKRVRGMRLVGPAWKATPTRAGAPVSVANRTHKNETP